MEFLRKDLRNLTEFFHKKMGLKNVLSVRQLFDFVVDPTIEDEEKCLEELSEASSKEVLDSACQEVEDKVFQQIYIPRKLAEVL